MFFDVKERRLPPIYFVAFSALPFSRAVLELAVMNILMAIHAVSKLERTLEVPAGMASNATYLDVGAEERIFCLGVVERKLRKDLFPSFRAVAVLALFLLKRSMVRVHVTIGAVLKLHAPEADFLRHLWLMALFASHLLMLAGERVSRLGVIEILGSLGILPVVYVVAFRTVRAKPAFVVILMTGHALGRCAKKGFCRVLSFQQSANLGQHVGRGMALFASNATMFSFQRITCKTMVEFFLRRLPMNKREVFPVMVKVTANALLAVGIFHF